MSAALGVTIHAQAEQLPVLYSETEIDLWLYRSRTVALLKRYGRVSVEIGRLPSLLGRECFRSRLTGYSLRNFEEVAIFVHDMEQAVNRLQPLEKKLVAMHVLEDYTQGEIARLLGCTRRWIEFQIPDAIDAMTRVLLDVGLIRPMVLAGKRKNPVKGVKRKNSL
jgi:DNA-directed RNA polymerase specialized sigma24 family protein